MAGQICRKGKNDMIESLHGTRETVNYSNSRIVRFYLNDNSENFPPHWHKAGEIIAPLSNTYEVTVGSNVLTLYPGDVLIIASGELHSIRAPETGARYILNYTSERFSSIPDLNFLFSTMSPYCLVRVNQSPQQAGSLMAVLDQIRSEYCGEKNYRDGEIYSLLLHFFVLLGREKSDAERIERASSSKQQEYSEHFRSVCNYIREHCTENLTLEQISEYAGFSKYHFTRLFKEFTGTTCHDYLTLSRIRWAQNLLADFSLSITEISMRSGFNSLATFNRSFKQQLGCTPSEYRKLNSDPDHPVHGTPNQG